MKKYQVEYTATIHGRMDIEANSKMEAEDKVWDFLVEHGVPPLHESSHDFLIDYCEEIEDNG